MEKYMHLSFDDDHDKQILPFLEAADNFRVLQHMALMIPLMRQ